MLLDLWELNQIFSSYLLYFGVAKRHRETNILKNINCSQNKMSDIIGHIGLYRRNTMHVTTCRTQQKHSLTITVQQYIIYTNCRGLQIPGTKWLSWQAQVCNHTLSRETYQEWISGYNAEKSILNIILSVWVVNSVLLKWTKYTLINPRKIWSSNKTYWDKYKCTVTVSIAFQCRYQHHFYLLIL